MDEAVHEAAALFKALSDPNRLAILGILSGGELCACVLLKELDISQPTLSHHMRILREAGLLRERPEGKWVHYGLDQKGLSRAKSFLDSFSGARAKGGEKARSKACALAGACR